MITDVNIYTTKKPPATNAAGGTNTELPKTLDDSH